MDIKAVPTNMAITTIEKKSGIENAFFYVARSLDAEALIGHVAAASDTGDRLAVLEKRIKVQV
jgi:hypothetical protein